MSVFKYVGVYFVSVVCHWLNAVFVLSHDRYSKFEVRMQYRAKVRVPRCAGGFTLTYQKVGFPTTRLPVFKDAGNMRAVISSCSIIW